MLVLTRKYGESILIGKDIRVTVSQIRGDKVKLRIEAPKGTRVIRSELENQLDKAVNFDIRVTVSQIRGNKVKLGIEAPKGTRVIRSELENQLDKAVNFQLGRVVITSNCEQKLDQDGELEEMQEFLLRHSSGDWGDMPDEDKKLNEESLKTGQRLMSSYSTPKGTIVWVITDAVGPSGQRETTTFLLPEDY